MSSPSIRFDCSVDQARQRLVDVPPILRSGSRVHRRAYERMAELDPGLSSNKPLVYCHCFRIGRASQLRCYPAHNRRIARSLSRRYEEEHLSVGRHRVHLLAEVGLEASADRDWLREPTATLQLRRAQLVVQFRECQRTPARFGDDAVSYVGSEGARQNPREKFEGGGFGKTSDLNARKARQDERRFIGGPNSEDEGDTVCPQAATDKGQDPQRFLIDPLCVIHDAQQALRQGGVGQQRESGLAYKEEICWRLRRKSKCGAQPVKLRWRKILHKV